MVENIINSGCHLIMRKCQRVLRIQNGKPRHNLLIREDMADFHLGLMIRDDRSCIHLGTGSHHRQNTSYRKCLAVPALQNGYNTFPMGLPHSSQIRRLPSHNRRQNRLPTARRKSA